MPAGDPWSPELYNFAHVSCPGESYLSDGQSIQEDSYERKLYSGGSMALALNLTCI